MRILLLFIFFTFFMLILEAPAQTRSTEITPDTRLCWVGEEDKTRPMRFGLFFPTRYVGKIMPKGKEMRCGFYATCKEVLGFERVPSGATTIPPSHQGTVGNSRQSDTVHIGITDCKDYGAGKISGGKTEAPPVAQNVADADEATKIIGEIAHVHKLVEILSKGRGQRWKRIPRGYKLRQGDTLRTGPRGRARLDFSVAKGDLNVINIGSNTTIKLDLLQERMNKKEPVTYFTLIRGALRSFLKQISPKTREVPFQIRSSPTARLHISTPNALIEKIGTDFAVNYDPNTKVTSVFLDHGKVRIKSGGRQVTLEPRTSVKIVNKRIGQPRTMSQSIWNDLVAQTTDETVDDSSDFFGPDESDMAVNSNSQKEDPDVALFMPGDSDEPLDSNASEWGADMDRLGARETVDTLLDSMKRYDQTAVLEVTSGFMRSVYFREIEKLGSLKAMLDKSGQRPASWTHECSVCTNSGQSCMAMLNITAAKTGKATKVIFTIENEKVTDGRPAQGETLRVFQAKKPACGERDLFDDF